MVRTSSDMVREALGYDPDEGPRIGQWLLVDGFELFRTSDHRSWVRVLRVVDTLSEAQAYNDAGLGLMVGPLAEEDLSALHQISDKGLCLYMLDPRGNIPNRHLPRGPWS